MFLNADMTAKKNFPTGMQHIYNIPYEILISNSSVICGHTKITKNRFINIVKEIKQNQKVIDNQQK